ncbi:hypothetical protein ACWC9T_37790 [Kitasatospora sp. NPDC001159]
MAAGADLPGPPGFRDWRDELESTHQARLAVARLRRALAAGADPDPLPGPELVALVEEFTRRRAAPAAVWNQSADLLEASWPPAVRTPDVTGPVF